MAMVIGHSGPIIVELDLRQTDIQITSTAKVLVSCSDMNFDKDLR